MDGDKWMDGWIRWMDGWKWMDGWMDSRINKWVDG